MHNDSVRAAKALIEQLFPSATSSQKLEYLRQFSAVKFNCHDDGLHGFGTFFNHSCDANCEMRGATDMNIYSTKKIRAGTELTICYLNDVDIHQPALVRSSILYNSWGGMCTCTRCLLEGTSGFEA